MENYSLDNSLKKYYRDYNKNGWDNFMQTLVLPAFNYNLREEFKTKNSSRFENFSFIDMEKFYDRWKKKKMFDDDILLFISFLAGDSFFENKDFEVWINEKRFDEPIQYSILDVSKMPYGMNFIRSYLISLPWWK